MIFLVKTTIVENYGISDVKTEFLFKSPFHLPLLGYIKELFTEAVENMTEDDLVNDCTKEDFDDDNGVFEEEKLVIKKLMLSPGMERETTIYQIVNSDNTQMI